MPRTLLVVSAHSADFVWRAAGAIATVTEAGGTAHVVALSYGERGESGELWKWPGQTEERVKEIRHGEALAAATTLGAELHPLDLGDYPLVLDAAAVDRLTGLIRELAPHVIITHAARDPFNPDHAVAHDATVQARQLASGAGVASAFDTIAPPELLLFEPHQPELCGFVPTTFLDITPVWEQKVIAMEAMGAQSYLRQYYSERAEHRANHARRISGRSDIKYAEAFQRELPVVDGRAVTDFAAFARLGVATVHEAAGRTGIVDLELTQVVPGSRVAGPARIARCVPGDNTMVHAAVAHALPGDVLVLTSGRAGAGRARRRAAGDAGAGARRCGDAGRRRDPRSRRARRARAPDLGALRARAGSDEGRSGRAGRARRDRRRARSGPAIWSCWTATVPSQSRRRRSSEVLARADERAERERLLRERYAAGELSYDVNGLRELVEG